MSRSRIQSAGPLVGPEQEVRMLRNTVTKLQQELLQSNAATQKITEQLNCMMLLVKRAWSGDQAAAVSVANIVGVAPPDFEEQSDGFRTTLSSKPKSRAVSNWAVLTIGILNREYKHLEQQEQKRAHYYLQQRQDYLEQQLVYHRDSQFRSAMVHQQKEASDMEQLRDAIHRVQSATANRSNTTHTQQQQQHTPLRRVNSLTELNRDRTNRTASFSEDIVGNKAFITQPRSESRPASCKTRPTQKHLYRPASQKQQEAIDLTWADLVVEPGHHQDHNVQTMTNENGYRLGDNSENERPKYRQKRISYDDPRRYNVNGLYDADNALGPGNNAFRKRPPSAKIQRTSDNLRARPKSAVYAKNERPLKYETTRPVSAITTSKTKQRPPSGKQQQQQQNRAGVSRPVNTPVQNGHISASTNDQQSRIINGYANTEETLVNEGDYYTDDDPDSDELVYDENAFKKLGIDLKEVDRELKQVQQIKVNIDKPKSVVQFEQDVQSMHDMEKVIRKTAMELQKKLGITEDGIV